jgi:SAM-dependent methyltransferase
MYQIHPSELLRRRRRCRPVVEGLLGLEREMVSRCNVCGSNQSIVLSPCDRYGFPFRTALCPRCGLVYSLDRFTREGYQHFYSTGGYRSLITRFKGREQTIGRIQSSQVNYSANVIHAVQGYIPQSKGKRLLDVGGSTGWVAREFVRAFGFRAVVLDPAPQEIRATERLGIEGAVGTIESWDTEERFDLILLCRTVEHLFDLRAALTKIRALLQPDGLFYCDVSEFLETCRREGAPEAATKVDHCYWLSQETAPLLFRSFGFDVVSVNLTLPPDQVGFLLRAGAPGPQEPVVSGAWLEEQVRRIRKTESDWRQYGRRPLDAADWLKQRAYSLRERLRDLASR